MDIYKGEVNRIITVESIRKRISDCNILQNCTQLSVQASDEIRILDTRA